MKEPVKIEASGSQVFANSTFNAKDQYFGDTHHHYDSKPNFSQIKFENEGDLPYPIFTEEVERKLTEQRIIIIASYGHFDQTYFGRQLIKRIKDRNQDIVSSELIQNEDNTGLIKQVEALDSSQAILFNHIHPTHLSYDFQKLTDLAINRNSYFIITSELSIEVWSKCAGFKSDYYCEITEENQYRQKELEGWFLRELEADLPLYLQDTSIIHPAVNVSDSLTIADLLEALPNPLRLKSLLDFLRKKETIPSDSTLIKEVNHLKSSDQEYITRWYNNLSHNQKILATTAALCDGIFHDQYFEIMQFLCQDEFWKSSCPELTSVDFHQLLFLPKRADETRFREGILLKSYYNSFRSIVVGLALEDYPRHLESLFRGITEVTKTTFSLDKYDNWKLYGTSLKIGVIRHVFIEASKDVNYHSFSFIESIYLELASNQNPKIQDLAAKSIARLRELGRDDFLFVTIDEWLNNHEIMLQVYLYIKNNHTDEDGVTRSPISFLKATIIRILAYAASYDQPNQLHHKIIEHLFDFVKEKDKYVLGALKSMLPKFIHHNIDKLKTQLNEILSKPGFSGPISQGLAESYSDYPNKTKAALEKWYEQATRKISEQELRKSITPAEHILLTVIKTLQKIEISAPTRINGYNTQEIYQKIEDLLNNHVKPAIKKEIVTLIAAVQVQNFDEGLKYTKILSGLNQEEQKTIVQKWTKIYIEQRAELEIANADFILEMNNKEFPIWIEKGERKLTEIEHKMMAWLDSGKPTAQKISTLAFLSFAKIFDKYEEEIIQRYHKEEEEKERLRQADLDVSDFGNPPTQRQTKKLSFWLRIRIFLYSIFETHEHRRALKEITRLLVNTNGYSADDLKLVIEKWKLKGYDNELALKMAKWLDRLF